jgi:hypothetical protein
MRLSKNPVTVLIALVSIPGLAAGLGLFFLSLFLLGTNDQPLSGRLNDASAFYAALLSMGLVSLSTIVAARGRFFGSSLARQLFRCFVVICAGLVCVLLVYSATLFFFE